MPKYRILIHLDGGIGDIIMGTPCVNALILAGHEVDVFIHGDVYKPIDLFRQWVGPSMVSSERKDFEKKNYDFYLMGNWVTTPFNIKNDKTVVMQAQYSNVFVPFGSKSDMMLHYARAIDNSINLDAPAYCGHSDRIFPGITQKTVVLFPGCKKEYPMKKWDKFDELAAKFDDVAVVGTADDLWLGNSVYYPDWILKYGSNFLKYDGKISKLIHFFSKKYNHTPNFGKHVKNYIGQLSLHDTASLINQAGLFIGNDGGLAYIAAALKKPSYIIFGPTDPRPASMKGTPFNVIRKNLDCQPCFMGQGKYSRAWKHNYVGCPIGMKCMTDLKVEEVLKCVDSNIHHDSQNYCHSPNL